jgi:hypothetical protein
MSIVEQYRKKSPRTFDSWLKMVTIIFKAVGKRGESLIIWKHLSTEKCQEKEAIATELEMYEAAIVYRDNVHKCYDYHKTLK